MLTSFIASVAAFVRREDGRTAVEYAIAVNLVVLLAIAGVSVSGHNSKRTINTVRERVSSAYHSTQTTVYSFVRGRSQPGASNPGRH